MESTPLNKKMHDRNGFDCGNQALNNYLRLMASQQSLKDNTRTFVLENEKNSAIIIGYYTLTMISFDMTSLDSSLKNKHKIAQSAGLIARLAVDKRYSKKGYGEWLLVDALQKLLIASDSIAFPLVIVDAKDGAVQFYKKFGFSEFKDTPKKLFLTIDSIRKSLNSTSKNDV